MKREKRESKFSLLILVVICVLILLTSFIWFQNALRENINQTNYEIMQETARQQLFNFETRIQGQLNQLQLYARSYENVDMNDYNAVKKLINVTEGAGSFHTISIADSTGKLVNNNNTAAGNILHKQYFKDAIAGNVAIGLKYSDDEKSILEMIYAVPIRQGETINGVLVGSELQSDVNETLMTDSFGGLGASFILDNEGNIILSSANGAEMIGDPVNYQEYLTDADAGGAGGFFSQADEQTNVHRLRVKDTEYIIIQNSVSYNGWSHVLQVDAFFVNSQRNRIASCVLILLLVVLVSVCAVIAFLFRLQARADRLRTKAERDLLTDLLNKKTFESAVENIMSHHSPGEIGALFIIDLDNFKAVNDTLGHMVGDQVLSGVAEEMRATFRQHDHLGRIGGDEFAVYLTFSDTSDANERHDLIQSMADRLCARIATLSEKLEQDITVSCSIGIALDPEHGTTYDELYQSADEALYLSKNSGKNKYSVFTHKKGGIPE
ncbi:MAG: sensor domain-containing diguanylate cyclase [Oscillospiraceae bacterium]|nr:sensor domain-containing diguanylate cyclase [Oscillospiraceae bacterium]